MRRRAILLAALFGLVLAGTAPAAAQCTITTTPMSFGAYDVFEATSALASTASLTYFCAVSNQSIFIQLGTGGAGTFFPRRMVRGGEHLEYNLYRDAAGTQIWGDGSGGTVVFTGTTGPPGHQQDRTFTVPIYGRIPAGQSPAAGVYTDTITVTLLF